MNILFHVAIWGLISLVIIGIAFHFSRRFKYRRDDRSGDGDSGDMPPESDLPPEEQTASNSTAKKVIRKITFADIGGIGDIGQEVAEIIDFFKKPERFRRLNAKMPKGVLLVGPHGTGKTLIAKALANECGVNFIVKNGSEFVEKFVGVGAARVRKLFEEAEGKAPCIIFIDEIDALGGARGDLSGREHDTTLNQLLTEMDGFFEREENKEIIILAATNRPEMLDPALVRKGRFDRHIFVGRPDVKGREEILNIHTRKTPLTENVNLKTLAKISPGFTGADIANWVNEAAILAARQDKKQVDLKNFEDALEKIVTGNQQRIVLSQKEREITAYHEAGHALTAFFEKSDPVHKVSIIPRGQALGITWQLSEDDRRLYHKDYLLKKIRVTMAGRAAEQAVFNQASTGAENDIQLATEIIVKMICKWGMSEKIGFLNLKRRNLFQANGSGFREYGEATADLIDQEVAAIQDRCMRETVELITAKREKLDKLAKALLEKETLDGEEIENILLN